MSGAAPPNDTEYYLGLITSYHADKPKFRAEIEAVTACAVALTEFYVSMTYSFDLDTAVGVQLDQVGVRVGRSRYVSVPLPNVYFSWGTLGLGWSQGNWRTAFDPVTGLTTLDDESYRVLLRAKIAANSWDGTNESLPHILDIVFPPTTGTHLMVIDNYDMSMTIAVIGTMPSAVVLALILGGYVPIKPEGVRVNYVTPSVSKAKMFAWGVQTDLLGGWGEAAWQTDLTDPDIVPPP